ncbi:MAG TPA: hypothetical protein VGM98_04960 [Schlesneria sp.]|jgi:hypothetical protein
MWIVFALIAEIFGLGVDNGQLESLRRRIAELDVSQIRLKADNERLIAENADLREIVDYFVRHDAEKLI